MSANLRATGATTEPTPRWPRPRLALVWLTLLVMAAHAWLLQAWPDSVALQGSASPAATTAPTPLVFNTRRVEATASPAAPAARPARQAPASAPPKPPVSPLLTEPALSEPATAQASAAPEEPTLEPNEKIAPSADATPAPPPPGQAAAPLVVPASLRLTYQIGGLARGMPYSAEAALSWLQEAGRYDAKLTVSVFLLGERSLSSTGEVTADGLVPRRFSDKSRRELAAHFLPEQGRISFSANTPDVPWQRGAQDRLSVFFQVASLMAGDPARALPGTQLPVLVVGPRDAEEWVFKVGPPETLDLPMGPTPTIYLLRLPRREYEQKTELWLAPQLGFLPVRIKQTHHNGDYVDQQLATSGTP